jgi:hypothetical protein
MELLQAPTFTVKKATPGCPGMPRFPELKEHPHKNVGRWGRFKGFRRRYTGTERGWKLMASLRPSLNGQLRNGVGDLAAHFCDFRAQQSDQPRVIARCPSASPEVGRPAGDGGRTIGAGNRPVRAQNHFAIVVTFKALYPDPDVITVRYRGRSG